MENTDSYYSNIHEIENDILSKQKDIITWECLENSTYNHIGHIQKKLQK
jgi:hypothetical protein